MTWAAVALLVAAFGGWVYVFVPSRDGFWRRSWSTAGVLAAGSAAALLSAGELGDAVGTIDAEAIVVGAGAGLGWLVATQIGHTVLCRLVPSFIDRVSDLYSIAVGDRRRDVLIALVTMAVAEEFVFRLVVQREFGLIAGVAAYTAVQAVERNWALILAAAACGVVFGALYEWQNGLAAPLIAHIVWTGALTFVWPLRGRGRNALPGADDLAITDGG